MKKTKIVCTIGPASQGEEVLRQLIDAGMNVCRFNFSHGSHEEHMGKFYTVQKLNKELGSHIAILMDTKGPEIRIKDFENGETDLVEGQTFALTTEDILGNNERVAITHKGLKDDTKVGNAILLDDGLIKLIVKEITDTDIICEVMNNGHLSNKKGVNAPGATLSMPYIGDKDREDIILGCKEGFDFIAASFVRTRQDVLDIKAIMKEYNGKMKIIAKIENTQGIENLEEILDEADGIMVARGDMGVEIPMEEVPSVQKRMIKLANAQGKMVITATQMLESMIKNPRPTRAEVTDVANAIYDGTSAIMLSGESATGKYPVEAVRTMTKIAIKTESDINYANRMLKSETTEELDVTTAVAKATCRTANNVGAAAIFAVTISGNTANMVSKYKPNCPIIGFSPIEEVCRQLSLTWGVRPSKIDMETKMEVLCNGAIQKAKERGWVKEGDVVVITTGEPLGVTGNTNTIRVLEVN